MEQIMTGLHHEVDFRAVRTLLVRETRAMLPQLVDRITTHIQQDVQSYAGSSTGRRHRLIELAASSAIAHFLETIEQPGAKSRSVDELFRRMGHGEATEGHGLDAMQASFRIVNREAWVLLRDYADSEGWSVRVLGALCDALFAYTEHLASQTQLGYDGAMRALAQDPHRARARLLDDLLRGAPVSDIHPRAVKVDWTMPERFVVITVEPLEEDPLPDISDLAGRCLMRADANSAVIVADPEDRAELIGTIRSRSTALQVASSWPVPREEVPEAWRWATRVLDLAARGVIERSPVLYCSEHRTQLWLHAEPLLRQRLCQELLRPLLAETPNSREILSETLLAWLESRDSAPAIAAKLGVHPQTVRYRWKRINELFGESLREPEFVVQVTMLLKASVPLWKAGDQSDFERFRSEDGK
jgi:hypothetical protein